MNCRSEWIQLATVVFLLCVSSAATALDFYIDGFGTASLSCFSSDVADYVSNEQPVGPGRSRQCDTGIDSLLGVQLELGLSESLEFGLQLIADRNEDRSYTPDVSVAQLRWRPTSTTTVRLGRMPTPAFLHSEDRQVRYALPWVRPPVEVYSLIPPLSQDGLEIIYEDRLGRWHAEWQGGISALDFDSPSSNSNDTYTVTTRQAYLGLTLQDSNTIIKMRYGYAEISPAYPEMDLLFNTLQNFAPVGAALADDLSVNDSPSHMLSLGFRRDKDGWLTMGEFAYRTAEGYIRDQYGAYLTQGRQFGPWMPYATLARRLSSGPDTDYRAQAFGPFVQSAVELLFASTRFDTTSVALGLSRQVNDQAILKLQADWIQPDKDSWGLYTNHAADYDYANPESDWLLTVSFDFVF